MREDWAECELGDITEVNPKILDKNEIDQELEVQFLPMRLVEEISNKIHLDEIRRFHEVQKGSYTYFSEGDVIFAKVTPCMENGKIAVARGLKNNIGFGSSEFHVFRTAEVLLNIYLFYFIIQESFRRNAQHNMTGAVGLRRVPKNYLISHSFPLPPLPEQRAIVAKIEELFSDLDKGIADLKKAQEQLKVYRQAVLKKAFEGELTNPLLKHGTIPMGWKKTIIKDVCENIKVGIVIKPKQYYSKDGKGIHAFRSANVKEFRVNDSNWVYFTEKGNNQNPRTKLKTGDVLIVRSGYPGTSCVVPPRFEGANAIDILIATPNYSKLSSEYLCAFNNSPLAKGLFNEGSRGVAQKHLNVGVYGKLNILVPPLEEQRQIVREIQSRLSVCDQMEQSITESLEKAQALRQSILKKAFDGTLLSDEELAACKEEKDYEPAGVLLERIKVEKKK
ncbi:MAG: restriction endonuclease subunit S [Bacteroidota bacterium]